MRPLRLRARLIPASLAWLAIACSSPDTDEMRSLYRGCEELLADDCGSHCPVDSAAAASALGAFRDVTAETGTADRFRVTGASLVSGNGGGYAQVDFVKRFDWVRARGVLSICLEASSFCPPPAPLAQQVRDWIAQLHFPEMVIDHSRAAEILHGCDPSAQVRWCEVDWSWGPEINLLGTTPTPSGGCRQSVVDVSTGTAWNCAVESACDCDAGIGTCE